jgi:nucleoid-associated protein YgaU
MGVRVRALVGTAIVVGLPLLVIRLLADMAGRPWAVVDFGDLGDWLTTTSIEDAITALARLAALALSYWLVASTLLYLTSVASGNRNLIRLTAPLTLPVVRRMADRLVAGSIVLGVAATPLIASTPARPSVPAAPSSAIAAGYVPEPIEHSLVGAEPSIAYHGRPVTPPLDDPTPTAPVAPEPAPAQSGTRETTAARGDHLWSMAEVRLGEHLGRRASDHEIAPYWRAVVEANRARLRSGDPDLIYPGETIALPDPAPFTPGGS